MLELSKGLGWKGLLKTICSNILHEIMLLKVLSSLILDISNSPTSAIVQFSGKPVPLFLHPYFFFRYAQSKSIFQFKTVAPHPEGHTSW